MELDYQIYFFELLFESFKATEKNTPEGFEVIVKFDTK